MRKIALIMIVAGILVIFIPLGGNLYTSYMQQQLIRTAETYLPDGHGIDPGGAESHYMELDNVFGIGAIAGFDNGPQVSPAHSGSDGADGQATISPIASSSPEPTESMAPGKTPVPTVKQILLGIMKIPRIDLEVPVVEGVNPENIRFAVGHIPGTAQIGSAGNSSIAGHRNYTFGEYFNRLDELVPGDEVYISSGNAEYVYTVYKKVVVEHDDTSVLKPEGNDRILTMITCTPIYIASHRLVVYARIEEQ